MNQDLWGQAVAKLKDKDRCHALHVTVDLEQLRAAVEERQRECVEKQWSVSRIGDNKAKIVLRDVFAKIAVWVQTFVEVGDIAVQYDPGHAALPWALVRFLLKVSIKDVQQYAVIAEGLESVARIITQYQVVEKLYLQRPSEGATGLKDCIVDLYVLVLRFLIRAQEFYLNNTVERAFKSMFDFRNQFQRGLDDIEKQLLQAKKYADLVDTRQRQKLEEGLENLTLEERANSDRLHQILEDLQQPISRMEGQLEYVHDSLNNAHRQEILQWLSSIPYLQHHVQSKMGVLEGTGSWFLNDDRLVQWRSSSLSSILWLRGIAGSGKSKLISTFIEQQIDEFGDGKNPMPCYFYCARNITEPERAKPAEILRSLVRQLSCLPNGVILNPVRTMYEQRKRDGFAASALSMTESTALIIELSPLHQLTTIVIDALDECDFALRDELFDALTEILQRSNGLVKILVSSRNERDISCELSGCLNIEIEAKNNQADIIQFVNHEVDHLIRKKRLLYGNVPEDLCQKIKQVLCEKASGMFRWVSLQLQFLRTLKRAETIWKRLGELPTDLSKIYHDIYRVKIEEVEEQGSIAKNAFNLLLSLQTPLKHEEFLQALYFCGDDKTDVSAEDLLDFGCNFLVLDAELDVFRFAHLSVREYLDTRSEYGPECSHALAAQFCLRYLCTSNPSGPFLIPRDPSPDDGAMLGFDDRVMSCEIGFSRSEFDEGWDYHQFSGYPFLDLVQEYACAYWAYHLAGSRHLRLLHPLKDMLRDFFVDTSQEVSPWFMYWNRLAIYVKNCFLAPRNGAWWTDDCRVMDSFEFYDMIHIPADYLFAASILGFCDLLEVRLRSKPDPLSVRSLYKEHNALQLACRYGHRDVARFLLDRGWGLHVENNYSLLSLASTDSHFETVKLLLSRGADPNGEDKPRSLAKRFPIIGAIDSGSLKVVKLLLDYGASADVEDFGQKAFHIAAIDGKQDIADLLLATSTDADKLPRSFCRQVFLLHKATRNGDEDLLNTTLENWPQGAQGKRYLDYALWDVLFRRVWFIERLKFVRFLKQRKPTVVNETCLKTLLAKGADANCSFVNKSVVSLIHEWGLVEGGGFTGPTRLSAGPFSILQLLVEHGADLGDYKFELKPKEGSD